MPSFDLGPETDPDAGEDRQFSGVWFALYGLLGFLILYQLAGYLQRDENLPPSARLAGYERSLRTLERTFDAARNNPLSGVIGGGDPSAELRELVSQEKRGDPRFERIIAIAERMASSEPLQPDDLPGLRDSKDPKDQAILRIYTAKELKEGELAKLEAALKPDSPSERWALRHARELSGLSPPAASNRYPAAMVAAGLVLGGALLVGLFVLFMWFAGGFYRKPAVGFPVRNLNHGLADRLAVRSLQLLGVFFFAPAILALVLSPLVKPILSGVPGADRVPMVLSYLIVIVGSLLLFKLPIGGRPVTLKMIGFEAPKASHFGWALCSALANVPIVLVVAILGQAVFRFLPAPEHPVSTELMGGSDLATQLSMLFVASVAAPLLEEIAFRGTMAPAMAKRLGVTGAILMSSFLFAAIHPTGVPAWPPLMAIGAMAAYITYRTGSLMPAIIMHAIHNFATLCLTIVLAS